VSLDVFVCESCGRAVFPRRLVCPDCGGTAFRGEPVETGMVEAVADRGDVRLGEVRTSAGPLLIARLVGDAAPGAEVPLAADGGVPVAGRGAS
jgi:uncharacterized OB-fold protein